MTPQEWFALTYEKRINTVKVFLQREYPEDLPEHIWPVFVLIEDATDVQLREWLEKGLHADQPITGAMLVAVSGVLDRGKREGYVAGIMRAVELAKKKSRQ